MSLLALSLQYSEYLPTFPDIMDEASISASIAFSYPAVTLLGSSHAVAALLIVSVAVTGAFSAQLIAVFSNWTYGMCNTYIKARARGKLLVYISHTGAAGFGLVMAGFSTGLYHAGVR